MKPLNYFRRILKDLNKIKNQQLPESVSVFVSESIRQVAKSVKFHLPITGRILEDLNFRCLDETTPLRLPFPICGFEYERPAGGPLLYGEHRHTRAAFVASEVTDGVTVLVFVWQKTGWVPLGLVKFPIVNYLDRSLMTEEATKGILNYDSKKGVPLRIHSLEWKGVPSFPVTDFIDEAGALLCFLNALQCSNVEITKLPKRTEGLTNKEASKVDQYHVLSLKLSKSQSDIAGVSGGTHRSPREHLRRGHIRILQSGEKIWINSTVVNAGKNYGKITKSYRVSK